MYACEFNYTSLFTCLLSHSYRPKWKAFYVKILANNECPEFEKLLLFWLGLIIFIFTKLSFHLSTWQLATLHKSYEMTAHITNNKLGVRSVTGTGNFVLRSVEKRCSTARWIDCITVFVVRDREFINYINTTTVYITLAYGTYFLPIKIAPNLLH